MKPATFFPPRAPTVRLTPLLALLALAAIAVLMTGLYFASRRPPASHFPYPYRLNASTKANLAIDYALGLQRERSERNPDSALELAALAGAYLAKARASGQASWYLLAEGTARASLDSLAVYNGGALLVLAEVAEARHEFGEAIRLAEEQLAYRPGDEGALSTLVTTRLARGEVALAAEAAETLALRSPGTGSLGLRALVRRAQGRDDDARLDLEHAIGLEQPGEPRQSAWLRVQLGRFYADHGRLDEAEALYSEALAIDDHPLARLELAGLETRRGHWRDASRHYQAVLAGGQGAATTFDHVALEGLARIALLRGRRDQADTLWQQAETTLRNEIARGAFGHRRALAELLLERGGAADVSEALALMRAETSLRRDVKTLEGLAWALARADQLTEASTVMQEALASGVSDAALHYRAGEIAGALGRLDSADRYRREARAIDPEFRPDTRHILDTEATR